MILIWLQNSMKFTFIISFFVIHACFDIVLWIHFPKFSCIAHLYYFHFKFHFFNLSVFGTWRNEKHFLCYFMPGFWYWIPHNTLVSINLFGYFNEFIVTQQCRVTINVEVFEDEKCSNKWNIYNFSLSYLEYVKTLRYIV